MLRLRTTEDDAPAGILLYVCFTSQKEGLLFQILSRD